MSRYIHWGIFAPFVCREAGNLTVNEAILHLKDGQSRTVSMPSGLHLDELLYYMRVPAAAAGRTLRLQVPASAPIEISATDIARLEIPPPYALINDFLTEAEQEQVLSFALTHAGGFQVSGAYNTQNPGDTTVGRRSRILDGPANGAMAAMVLPKLQALIPTLWSQLHLNPMPLNTLECQVTAHGDGDFFATHTDNGAPDIAYRRISYVYYFHREPKQFNGGHLCLYNTLIENGSGTCGQLAADIDPPRNGLMIFPTFIYHGVTPIRCASQALTDQRLTLNGWLF